MSRAQRKMDESRRRIEADLRNAENKVGECKYEGGGGGCEKGRDVHPLPQNPFKKSANDFC